MSASPSPSRPAKRPRLSFESAKSLQHDSELWFEDGTIVLVAQDVAFRVYRGVLAAHSTIFSDMLMLGRADVNMYDDCPRVDVSDSSVDLRHFLRALQPETARVNFCRNNNTVPVSDELFSIIRLAHKYQVEDLLRQALDALQDHYFDFDSYSGLSPGSLDQNIAVVNIARLTDRPKILPFALYGCHLLGSAVFDGYKRSDGTVEHLDEADLRRSVTGGLRMILARQETICSIISRILSRPSKARNAHHRLECGSALCSKLVGDAQEDAESTDILSTIPWRNLESDPEMCSTCCDQTEIALDKGRRKLWRQLPAYFDVVVEGWI